MIEVGSARVRYAGAASALVDVSCFVEPGERVALIGANGSGKSTLGALMCGMRLADAGTICVDGLDPALPPQRREIERLVGFVQQNPADQLVCTEVGEEVAFGPRNLGLTEQAVRERVSRALSAVELTGCGAREVFSLSGGEQQRVALAGVLALDPRYLVLDEVGASLDAGARASCRALLARLARRGCGIVEITHDPLEVLGCDRAIVLERGSIVWQGTVRELLIDCGGRWDATLGASGFIAALRWAISQGCPYERARETGGLISWFQDACASGRLGGIELAHLRGLIADSHGGRAAVPPARGRRPKLALERVCFAYGEHDAVRDVSLIVEPGEIVLIAGRSGSGKSTLAALAAGLIPPSSGAVRLGDRSPRPGDVGLVFQAPEQQLFCDSVEAELMFAPSNRGCGLDEARFWARRTAARVGIGAELADRDPFSLSGGQARRLGIAAALSSEPSACIFDEPTAGLDVRGRAELFELIAELAESGHPILVVTHDLDEWLTRVDRVALLADGGLSWVGPPAVLAADPTIFRRAKLALPESSALLEALGGDGAHPFGADAATDARLGVEPARAAAAGCGAHARGEDAPSAPIDSEGGARGACALERFDARVILILLLAMSAAIFSSDYLPAFAVWCAALVGASAACGARAASVPRAIRPILGLIALIVCANLISCDGTADVRLVGPVGLRLAGGIRAGVAVARIALLAGFSGIVAAVTEPQRIATAMARFMRPLARLGVPVAALSLALSVALRSIPLVGEELERIRRAQRARGVRLNAGGPVARGRSWMAVLVPLTVGLLRRSDRLAASMDARCYAGASRVMPPPAPLSLRDRTVLAIGLLAMALVAAAARLL